MAGKYSTFHVFCSTTECSHDGRGPQTGLIQATNGNFIGTTHDGGPRGVGILYEITPASKLTMLYNFCSRSSCTDGWNAGAPPIQAADGNLYGTTEQGGTTQSGVLYELTMNKNFTDLYDFCSQGVNGACGDGGDPLALVQGTDGNFYGVTVYGGTSTGCGPAGCGGTLFEFASTGRFNSLYDFCAEAKLHG